MKKIFAFIIALLPIALYAQVRVVSAPEAAERVEQYDSINNCPRLRITGFVGQEVFLPPPADRLKKYGYQGIYRTENESIGSIPCDEIAGHTFTVTDVVKKDATSYKLHLLDKETGDKYYYNFSVYRSSWEFITLGYKAKYEAVNKGKEFVALRIIAEEDINTGEFVHKERGAIWTFQEIIANKDNGEIGYLYTNSEGQTIAISEHSVKNMKPKAEIDKLKKKYGPRMCDLAVQGTIKVGMPEELVRIAKGDPRTINRASYGNQWVYGEYGDDCVYFKNGKVTGWN